jgi:hypothetical protein
LRGFAYIGPRSGREAESDFRGHLITALGGLVLAAGAYFTGRTDCREAESDPGVAASPSRRDRLGRPSERSAVGRLAADDGRDRAAGYVSQLRRTFDSGVEGGAALLVTKAPGYSLTVSPDQVDLAQFEQLAANGREALAAGESDRAAALLAEALRLWRGPPLADFSYESWAPGADRQAGRAATCGARGSDRCGSRLRPSRRARRRAGVADRRASSARAPAVLKRISTDEHRSLAQHVPTYRVVTPAVCALPGSVGGTCQCAKPDDPRRSASRRMKQQGF